MRSARFKAAHCTRIRSSSSPQTGSGASPILSTDSSPGFSTITAFIDEEAAQFGGGNPPELTRARGRARNRNASARRARRDAAAEVFVGLLPGQGRFEEPGGARLRIRGHVIAGARGIVDGGFARHNYVERVGTRATVGDESRNLANVRRGQRRFDVAAYWHDTIVTGGATKRSFSWPGSPEPYGNAGLLPGHRQELRLANHVVLTREGELLAA